MTARVTNKRREIGDGIRWSPMPRSFLRSVLLFGSVVPITTFIQPVNADPLADKTIVGCWYMYSWHKKAKSVFVSLCFDKLGKISTQTFSTYEGFGAEGFYQMGARLRILGFPGEGWPSNHFLESCSYSFPDDQTLRLGNCELSGDWQSGKPENSN